MTMHTELSLFPEQLLLIEDDPTFPRLIHGWLRYDWPKATQLRTASTLREGLAVLQQQRIDLAIVDLFLPDARGLQAPIAVLQALPAGEPPMPIVVLTGHQDAALPYQALAMGVEEWLSKDHPALRQAFNTYIKRAWARHQYLRQLIAQLRAPASS